MHVVAPRFAGTGLTKAEVRRMPSARTVLRSWREMVPRGGRTLVACSGGADSTALVLMLAAATNELVVGHVVHDMRPAEEALADRDAVRGLAERCGVGFAEASVQVPRGRGAGNVEAVARHLRYGALARLAIECGCGFVATGHHADDQLESVLMALVRGAGSAGLRGLAPSRALGERRGRGVTLVRPMLGVTHAENEALCRRLGVMWREDATNADTSRLRAALRTKVLPVLEEIRPGASKRASRAAGAARVAHDLLRREAESLVRAGERERRSGEECVTWRRSAMRAVDEVLIGETIRLCLRRCGGRGLDALGTGTLARIATAVRAKSGEPKRFDLAGGGSVEVTRESVRVRLPTGTDFGAGAGPCH